MKHLVLSVCLGLVALVLLFAPFLFQGKALAPLDMLGNLYPPWSSPDMDKDIAVSNSFVNDAIEQYLPYRYLAHRAFRSDDSILWNDLNYSGQAQYANTMALYADWTMQLHRWFNFWTAWTVGILAQFSIALLGMYALLRVYRQEAFAALSGAIAYSLNGIFLAHVYHRWTLSAFCWLPIMLIFIKLGHRRHRWAWPFVPLFLALGLLGGHLQYAIFYATILFVLWIVHPESRKPLFLASVLGLGLAAFMLLPSIVKYLEGLPVRPSKQSFGYLIGGWQAPIRNLLAYATFPFPFLLSSPETLDVYNRVLFFESSNIPYFGASLTLIALCVPFSRTLRAKVPREALALLIVGLVLPLTPLNGIVYQRILILFVFGGILCALPILSTADPESLRKPALWIMRFAAILLCLWIVAGIVMTVFHEALMEKGSVRLLSFADQSGYRYAHLSGWMRARLEQFLVEKRPWHPRQLWPIGSLAVTIATFYGYSTRKIPRHVFFALIAALTLFESVRFSRLWFVYSTPPDSRETLYANNHHTDLVRNIIPRTGKAVLLPSQSPHRLFRPNTLSTLGVAQDRGYESVVPKYAYLRTLTATHANDAACMGITHAIADHEADLLDLPWLKIAETDRLIIYTNTISLGRYVAYTADAMSSPPIVKHSSANRVLELPAGTSSLEVRENWDQGWQYKIGNRSWQTMEKTPDTFMLSAHFAPLPELSRVHMRYRPDLLIYGLSITACFLVIWAIWVFREVRIIAHPTH